MSHNRVIPRDLFNEAKLLKCLGRLALILHDYEGRYPIQINHEGEPFVIEQNPGSGDLYCSTLKLVATGNGVLKSGTPIDLESSYNSKEPYPLMYTILNESYGSVFDDNGEFTIDFLEAIGYQEKSY